MYQNCSEYQKQFMYTTRLPRFELGIFMYWTCNSINNLSSYFWLVDAKIRASDKDLLVSCWRACLRMFLAKLKARPQISHWWGFSLEWVNLCWTRLDFRVVCNENKIISVIYKSKFTDQTLSFTLIPYTLDVKW